MGSAVRAVSQAARTPISATRAAALPSGVWALTCWLMAAVLDQGLLWASVLWLAWPAFIVAHELGHAVAAAAAGHTPERIELTAFGGSMHYESCNGAGPLAELSVSLAGPFMNAALAAVFHVADLAVDSQDMSMLLQANAVFNAVSFVANLAPTPASDGRRALAAARAMMRPAPSGAHA